MWKEFKKFLLRGNVVDLAVAVVIGAAFTAVVKSVVEDLLMPIIGALTAGVNFKDLYVDVGGAKLMYGNLIQLIIQFVIIAFFVFLVVKSINHLRERSKRSGEEEPAAKSDEVLLLEEIRDLLKADKE